MWSARWLTYQTEMFIDTSGDSNFLPNVTAHWLTQQRDGRYILFCCEDSAEYGHRADIELKNLTSSSAQYPEVSITWPYLVFCQFTDFAFFFARLCNDSDQASHQEVFNSLMIIQ